MDPLHQLRLECIKIASNPQLPLEEILGRAKAFEAHATRDDSKPPAKKPTKKADG